MNKLLCLMAFCSANAVAIPVNVNSADAKTISESLSGVSLKKAESIVAYRIQNGYFKNIVDLKKIFGIGDKTLAVNGKDILLTNPRSKIIRHAHTRERHGHTLQRRQH